MGMMGIETACCRAAGQVEGGKAATPVHATACARALAFVFQGLRVCDPRLFDDTHAHPQKYSRQKRSNYIGEPS